MARTGRPRVVIDQKIFENLCAIWCTLGEIASQFDCSPDSVEKWCKRTYNSTFTDVYAQKAPKGAVSIRRKQFQLAQEGNVALLIWIGKQKLGQREPYEPREGSVTAIVEGKAEVTLKWNDEDNPRDAAADPATETV